MPGRARLWHFFFEALPWGVARKLGVIRPDARIARAVLSYEITKLVYKLSVSVNLSLVKDQVIENMTKLF